MTVEQAAVETVQTTTEESNAADNAAFEGGFDSERGSQAVVADAPKVEKLEEQPRGDDGKFAAKDAKEAPVAEVPKTEPEKPADPLEGLRKQLEDISSKVGAIDKIDHRMSSFEGRLGPINKALEGLAAAKAAAVTAAVADVPVKTQQDAAAKYSAALKNIQRDYPDLAEFVEAARAELRAGFPAQEKVDVAGLKTEVSTSVSQQLEQARAAAAQARVLAFVDFKHDGWEETVKTPEFKAWHAAQAPEVQALSGSDKAKDAIRMLDLYAEARKKSEAAAKAKADNEARLKRAATPKGVPAVEPTTTDNDAFESGFNNARGG